MMKYIALLTLMVATMANAGPIYMRKLEYSIEMEEAKYNYCDCSCDDNDGVGIWIPATHPKHSGDPPSETKQVLGVQYAFACVTNDQVFEYLHEGEVQCETKCESEDPDAYAY